MNKNFLILALCLLLTSSQAMAKFSFKPKCNESTQKSKISPHNSESALTEDVGYYRNFAEQIKKERATIANALSLTEEQAKYRVDLMKENSAKIEEKFRELYSEHCKLKVLQVEKASKDLINQQKNNIKSLENQLDIIVENENQQFKKILDREQRSKLNLIKKLQRQSIKDSKHQKDYYKSNPKMRPFAMPKKQVQN